MLGHFVSEEDVGIYSVAAKVSSFMLIGHQIALPIVSPLFSQFYESRDHELIDTLFRTITKWVCYSGLVIFACIAIFRAELLHVFGRGFTAGSSVLLILAAGLLVAVGTGPTGALLTMMGKQKWELGNTISMAVVNFILNLVLIPKLGVIGAAIATAFSFATINGLKLVQVHMLFGLATAQSQISQGRICHWRRRVNRIPALRLVIECRLRCLYESTVGDSSIGHYGCFWPLAAGLGS